MTNPTSMKPVMINQNECDFIGSIYDGLQTGEHIATEVLGPAIDIFTALDRLTHALGPDFRLANKEICFRLQQMKSYLRSREDQLRENHVSPD